MSKANSRAAQSLPPALATKPGLAPVQTPPPAPDAADLAGARAQHAQAQRAVPIAPSTTFMATMPRPNPELRLGSYRFDLNNLDCKPKAQKGADRVNQMFGNLVRPHGRKARSNNEVLISLFEWFGELPWDGMASGASGASAPSAASANV